GGASRERSTGAEGRVPRADPDEPLGCAGRRCRRLRVPRERRRVLRHRAEPLHQRRDDGRMSGTASRSRRGRRLALVASLAFAVSGCGDSESDGAGERATLAFVTNGKYAFWEPAHAGVVKAGQELGVEVLFRTPENNMNDQ